MSNFYRDFDENKKNWKSHKKRKRRKRRRKDTMGINELLIQIVVIAFFVMLVLIRPPEYKEGVLDAFDYVNELRVENGLKPIEWNEQAHLLAVERSKDMNKRYYFSHATPDGKCVNDFKYDYGFSIYDILAENIASGHEIFLFFYDYRGAINSWMNSPGHRDNLLYYSHVSGAIGCDYGTCTFLGVHNDSYGLGAVPCSAYQ